MTVMMGTEDDVDEWQNIAVYSNCIVITSDISITTIVVVKIDDNNNDI